MSTRERLMVWGFLDIVKWLISIIAGLLYFYIAKEWGAIILIPIIMEFVRICMEFSPEGVIIDYEKGE